MTSLRHGKSLENLHIKSKSTFLGANNSLWMYHGACACERTCVHVCRPVDTDRLKARLSDSLGIRVSVYCCWLLALCSLKIEERLVQAQNLTQGWEEIKHMKAELWIYLQDADQQLQNMKRRHSELELNIAQNMVSQVKVGINGSPGETEKAKMGVCPSVLKR